MSNVGVLGRLLVSMERGNPDQVLKKYMKRVQHFKQLYLQLYFSSCLIESKIHNLDLGNSACNTVR